MRCARAGPTRWATPTSIDPWRCRCGRDAARPASSRRTPRRAIRREAVAGARVVVVDQLRAVAGERRLLDTPRRRHVDHVCRHDRHPALVRERALAPRRRGQHVERDARRDVVVGMHLRRDRVVDHRGRDLVERRRKLCAQGRGVAVLVTMAEEARLVQPEHGRGTAALVAPPRDVVPGREEPPRIAQVAVGDDHDVHRVAAPSVQRKRGAAADGLVVGMRRDHQHGSGRRLEPRLRIRQRRVHAASGYQPSRARSSASRRQGAPRARVRAGRTACSGDASPRASPRVTRDTTGERQEARFSRVDETSFAWCSSKISFARRRSSPSSA